MKALFLIAILAAVGCEGKVDIGANPDHLPGYDVPGPDDPVIADPKKDPVDPNDPIDPVDPTELEAPLSITPEESVVYMRRIAQMLVSRPLNQTESDRLLAEGTLAIGPILAEWETEDGFADAMKFLMQTKLRASGEREGINFEIPGYLVKHVVNEQLPISTVLTADYCVDENGAESACDTGAPYTAGLLTTRAFLAGNASRFNLGRASTMLKVFACRIYPMEDDLQPRLAKPELIAMFQAETLDEQTVEEAKNGFGNGTGCFTCHGQFGAHAQLFVKYNEDGLYVADADGLQDPEGELGRSVEGLMTSHFIDPAKAQQETTQMFGEEVSNISEAARVLAGSEVFVPCMVRNVLEHTFGLTDSEGEEISDAALEKIAARLTENGGNPSFGDLVRETFVDPQIVSIVIPQTSESGATE